MTISSQKELRKTFKEEYLYSKDSFGIGILSLREVDVLRERYLNSKTLQEVGNRYNVTRDRIRQVEIKALYKLKRKGIINDKL